MRTLGLAVTSIALFAAPAWMHVPPPPGAFGRAIEPPVPVHVDWPVVSVSFDLDVPLWRSQYDEHALDPVTGLTPMEAMRREVAAELGAALARDFGFLDFRPAHEAADGAARRLQIRLRADDDDSETPRTDLLLALDGAARVEVLPFRSPDQFRKSATPEGLKHEIVKTFTESLPGAAPALTASLFSTVSIGSEVFVLRRDTNDVCFLPFRYEECRATPPARIVLMSSDGFLNSYHGLFADRVDQPVELPPGGEAFRITARGAENAGALLERHGGPGAHRPFRTFASSTGIVHVQGIFVTDFHPAASVDDAAPASIGGI